MSTTYRIGPAVILTSASISDPLSDWTEVHRTRGGITVSMPDPMSSRARTNDSAAPVAAWTTQGVASVGFKMVNRDITTMAALIPGATAMNVSTKDALKINTALAKLTPVAVAVVPLSEYNDDKQFLGSANAVVFEKAVFRLGDMESSVDTDTEELDGYMVDIHSVSGVVSVGYAEVAMPELNPQGLLFLWQPSIDAITPLVGEGAGTFTRATTATYTDDDGVIQSAASGEPRYQDGGLLLEPQRTNLHWLGALTETDANLTTTGSQADPTGGTSGLKVVHDNSTDGFLASNEIDLQSSTTYTISLFVKWSTGTPTIRFEHNSVDRWGGAFFYSFTLSLSGVSVGGAGGSTLSTIGGYTNIGNGWYRLWVTVTTGTVDGVDDRFLVRVSGSASDAFIHYGPQLEQGSYPTSYIPTSGTTVTRNADALAIPFTSQMSASGLSVLQKGLFKATPSSSGLGLYLSDLTTSSSEWGLVLRSSGRADYYPPGAGSSSETSGGPTFTNGVEDDIVVNIDVPALTLSVYDGSDVEGTASSEFVASNLTLGGGILERSTAALPFVQTAFLITKDTLTPAQLRRILR